MQRGRRPAPQQTADDNQLLAIALTVGAAGEELTDQNANNRAAGKETDHRRADVHFVGQKQAQGRGLQRPGNAVRKATIKKAEEVTSNPRRGERRYGFPWVWFSVVTGDGAEFTPAG